MPSVFVRIDEDVLQYQMCSSVLAMMWNDPVAFIGTWWGRSGLLLKSLP